MTVHDFLPRPLALVMVGKPARGKSYTARKLSRYLSWTGYRARVFNVGSYRRHLLGPGQDHSFFDPRNEEGLKARQRMAEAAMDDLVRWTRDGGEVAIYDATNSTRSRRAWVAEELGRHGIDCVFVELFTEDQSIIDANIRQTKLSSPDYRTYDPDQALKDFRTRVAHYESVYEPLTDESLSFIRVLDAGRSLYANRLDGYLPTALAQFLLNLHLGKRSLYLSRHGESLYNVEGRIGGDSALSPRGEAYAVSLDQFLRNALPTDDVRLWTSTLRRTQQTARHLPWKSTAWRPLDEIEAGVCNNLTYQEIAERMPDEYAARKADKLRYRYPRGESYEDVISRVTPVILELERQTGPVVIIAHQAILRALYAYFHGEAATAVPHLSIPLHTVIQLTPTAYGCDEVRTALPPNPKAHFTAGI